jgi:hypothetical protein
MNRTRRSSSSQLNWCLEWWEMEKLWKFEWISIEFPSQVQVYRFQTDKLLRQVKNTLQTCNSTFYEINWWAKTKSNSLNLQLWLL